MKRTILLFSTMTIAVLAVSGAMVFGMSKPAQSQSVPEPPCTTLFCLDKTATPSTATVGEPITFTITERCPGNPAGCRSGQTIVDTLPSELIIKSVDANEPTNPDYQCSTSGNTVTCPPFRNFFPTAPFTVTIVATPTECGTFTNTASKGIASPITATATFTVVGCAPPTKEECKKGGWEEFGFPDQGTCVSAWNRQNRQ
jgi:uncharacterized repeat protein (TIGR01451 family)